MYSRTAMGLPGVLRARQSREKKHRWTLVREGQVCFMAWTWWLLADEIWNGVQCWRKWSEITGRGQRFRTSVPGPLVWLPWMSGINSEDKEKEFLDSWKSQRVGSSLDKNVKVDKCYPYTCTHIKDSSHIHTIGFYLVVQSSSTLAVRFFLGEGNGPQGLHRGRKLTAW